MTAEFRILGPLEVGLGRGREARVPGGNARRLLCVLLVHRGAVVPSEEIVDSLWAEAPPANARNAVQVVASRLRTAIGADVVVSSGGGYGVRIDPGACDADRFEALLARGREELAATRPGEAAATLTAALALWRGPALADVRGEQFAQPEIARLEALRLECTTARIAADLAVGESSPIGELEALVLEHPLDERVRELHMLALYRAGRQADALAAYRDSRRALLDGLGLEPGQTLRTLEAQILQHAVPDPTGPVAAPAAGEGDRRRVTCVFARLVPERLEDVDPEALSALVGAYHDAVRASCRRHGGTVSELRSDGAVVVFGIPTAHEDDALRAVRVALELQAEAPRLGPAVGSAAGVCTGVVVTPTRATPLFGNPVTIAEALARGHGDVRVAEPTRVLVEHAARGASLADGSYRVDSLIDDAPAIRRRLDRPLAGRSRELDALRSAYALGRDERAWVLATVLGEPGIGKSRLAAELPAALPSGATILAGRCPPYGEGTTYRPLRDVVLQACAGRTLADMAVALNVHPDVVERVAATVGLAPGSAGEEAPWAFRQFLGALSRDLPVVLVIDDAHWAEPGLLDLLAEIARFSGSGPGLLVCLARPELLESRPGWGRGLRRVLIELGPLSAAESRRLLDGAGVHLGAAARRRIAATAAGNPLFLEQLATYVDERHADGDLPPAIRVLLAARFDLLEPAERATLCYGSIQGDGFTAASLHALAQGAPLAEIEGACESLVRRDLLTRRGTLEFRHALVRETAYDTLSKAARARLHERHATWLAWLENAPPDTDARIGYQLEAAHRCMSEIGAPGADGLAVRARGALARAARLAHRQGDLPGEIGLLERAIRFTAPPPLERAELLPALTAALFAAGSFDRATVVAEEAVHAGEDLAAPVLHARALVERERLRVYQEQATIDIDASLRVVDGALHALDELGDDLGTARAHYLRCELVWMGGDPEAGSASAARMLECARRAGSGFEASAAIGYMAWSLVQGVTPVGAALERCGELEARLAGDRVARLEVAGYRGVLLAMAGRLAAGRREMAVSRHGLAELGLRQACAYMALFDAQLEVLAGDAPAAERAVRDAERITAETGNRWFQATVRVDLALALLARGAGIEEAAAVRAIEAIPAPADAEWVVKRHRARALLAAGSGELDLAVEEAREATAAADRTNLVVFRADAHRTRADVLLAAGDREGATHSAAEALRLYEAKGNATSAAEVRCLLDGIRARTLPSTA